MISADAAFPGEEEPSLAVDAASGRVYAGWKFGKDGFTGAPDRVGFASRGEVWSLPQVMAAPVGSAVQSDPWLAVDSHGSVYVERADPRFVYVSRSDDGGRTWTEPVALPGTAQYPLTDEPRVVAAADGRLYLAYTIVTSDRTRGAVAVRSSGDRGTTWSPPVIAAAGYSSFGASLVPLADGRLLLAFGETTSESPHRAEVYVTSSSDSGAHWTTPVRVSRARLGISAYIGNDWPSMTPSNHGVVLSWRQPAGDRGAVALVSSSPDGRVWSKPHPLPGKGDQFMPMLAELTDGSVAAAWYALHGKWITVQTATSPDGGRSWTAARRVSAAPIPAFSNLGGFHPTRLGDYLAIAGGPNNSLDLAWTQPQAHGHNAIEFASSQDADCPTAR